MPGKSLLELEPATLGRILNKCNEKTFCRLQQTCHGIHRFVRTHKNVTIQQEREYSLDFTQFANGIFTIDYGNPLGIQGSVSIDGFFGMRMNTITLPYFICEQLFVYFCNLLDIYNISAVKVTYPEVTSGYRLNVGDSLRILRILRPTQVHLNSLGSNRYEALLYCEDLEKVEITLDAKEVMPVANKLAPHIPSVGFVINESSPAIGDLFYLSEWFGKLINRVPSHHRVYLQSRCDIWNTFADIWVPKFDTPFYFMLTFTRSESNLTVCLTPPFPPGSRFQMSKNRNGQVNIVYESPNPPSG